jgi:hypothetical protein
MNRTFEEIVKTTPGIVKKKLEQLKFLRERPDFHPEPSAYHHIKIVTERLIQTGDNDLIMAGVLHDIAKFDTVKENPKNGFPTSPGHDIEAYNLIMNRIEIQEWIHENDASIHKVANICKNHMRFHQLGDMRPTKREAQIETWKNEGIYEKLKIFGAADNMLENFDLKNLEKSWKFMRDKDKKK